MQNIRKNKTLGVTIAAAAILLGGLSACSKSDTSAQLVAQAKQFQLKGDRKAAIIQLKNAIQKNPEDVEARLVLGNMYNETGDAVSAEKELRKALSLGAGADKVWPALAKALLMQQKFQKVIDESQATLATASPDLLVTRGDAYLALAQADKAKESYEAALKVKPDFTNALIGLARHALTQRDIAAANGFAEQAITKDVNNAEAWMFQGDMLRAQNKPTEALAAYDKVLALKPDHRNAHLEKAYVEIGAKQYPAAHADIAAAKKAAPGSLLVYYAQALLDFNEGKPAAALESLQKVLRAAPEHMPSILLAGAVEFSLGSTEQAEQHLKKYLEQFPQNGYARKLMVSTLLKMGRTGDALNALAPALADGQNDPQLLALAGDANLQARDFAKATDYFQKASALVPKAAELHTALALSKLGQGDSERAISELELSTKLDATSAKAGILLVLTELRLKHYDKALAAVQTLEKAQPKDAMVQNLKGGVYLGRNDLPNAKASFEKAVALQPGYFPAVSNLAQLALQEKQPEVAKQLFMGVLEKDKKNVDAMTALAGLAATQGHPEEVTQWLEKASAENPAAAQPAIRLTRHYLGIDAKQKALTVVRKASVANPASLELLDLLGQVQVINGDNNAALETYSKLVGLSPKSTQAQLRLASVHALMKNDAAATDDLKKAVALKPDLLEAQVALMELAMRAKKPDQALSIIRDVQKQRPKETAGFLLEGDFQISQDKPALALQAYQKAYLIKKSPLLAVNISKALRATGQEKEATARLAQWRKENPTDTVVPLYIAETQISAKQNKAAIEVLQGVIKQDPKNVVALNNLAWLYQQEKDPRALETAENANKLAGNNAAIMDTLGWILVEQGNAARGVPILQKAVSLTPAAVDIRYHLATGLSKSGDKAGARKELERVIADGKGFAQLEAARAMLQQL